MVDVPPARNLPNEATPWGRWIEDATQEQFGTLSNHQQQLVNLDTKITSSNNDLGKKVQQIGTAANNATAAANSATAAANSASAAVAGQVSPAAGASQNTSFTLSSAFQTLVSISFTVPTGYTRAICSGSGFVHSYSNAGGGSGAGDFLHARIVIGGNIGPDSITGLPANAQLGASTAFNSVTLTGIGGGSFTVDLQSRLSTGPGTTVFSNATASATVMFLR